MLTTFCSCLLLPLGVTTDLIVSHFADTSAPLLLRCQSHCSLVQIKTVILNLEQTIHTQLEICCLLDLRKPMYLKLCCIFFPSYISWLAKNLYRYSQAFPVSLRHFIQKILEKKNCCLCYRVEVTGKEARTL